VRAWESLRFTPRRYGPTDGPQWLRCRGSQRAATEPLGQQRSERAHELLVIDDHHVDGIFCIGRIAAPDYNEKIVTRLHAARSTYFFHPYKSALAASKRPLAANENAPGCEQTAAGC
jgi:hypothetical protein